MIMHSMMNRISCTVYIIESALLGTPRVIKSQNKPGIIPVKR